MSQWSTFTKMFKRSSTSIRLAELKPGSGDDTIEITMKDVDMHEVPYRCISYDRSENNGNVEVSVDGEKMSVPENLSSALYILRRSDSPRFLWADVLLGSGQEQRRLQARETRKIIENAEGLVAWLGQSHAASSDAFDVIRTMANRWQQAYLHSKLPENLVKASPEQFLEAQNTLLSHPSEDLQPGNSSLWKAVTDILSSSYFQSIQSIPDIVLARQTDISMGNESISWHDFIRASQAWPTILVGVLNEQPNQEMIKAWQLVTNLEVAHRRHRDEGGLELLPMIQSSRECTASDPREYVFSMLPITRAPKRVRYTDNQEEPPLVADYSKSVQDVFKEAARYIVHERQDTLLWWCERPPYGKKIKDLPSWVPDFSSTAPKSGALINPNNGLRAWTDSLQSRKPIYVDDQFSLHVQGHALERIHNVSPVFTEENCRRLCLTEWQNLNVPRDEEANGDRWLNFYHTLILNDAGVAGETMERAATPPAEMGESFQSLLAEERTLELLQCTLEELKGSTELQAKCRENEDIRVLAPLTGKSADFETVLRKNAIGRRFFYTWNGRMGMTAIELRPASDDVIDGRNVPNWDKAMGDWMGHAMITHFQKHVQDKDPKMAEIFNQSLKGELTGQTPPGARSGDLVTVLAGGFQPCLLRNQNQGRGEDYLDAVLQPGGTYTYVGDCHMHGVMDGEWFTTKDSSGQTIWKPGVELKDISIV